MDSRSYPQRSAHLLGCGTRMNPVTGREVGIMVASYA
jgi:hypothetical protein